MIRHRQSINVGTALKVSEMKRRRRQAEKERREPLDSKLSRAAFH